MSNLKRFLLNERGATALLFALLLIPLIGFLGLAIDSSRGYAVKHRLQEAIDAAALAGARNFDDKAHRKEIIDSYFYANWRGGFQFTDRPHIEVLPDDTARTISVTGSVNMETLLMPAVGGVTNILIGSVNTAYKDISFVELALALDTTTSMRLGTGASATIQPSDPASRRINIMKAAAVDFVNGLYTQDGDLKESIDNLRVSLIPFTSMVNVGDQHIDFLASNSLTGLTWDYPKDTTTQNSWRGCVFERSFYSNLANGGTYPGHDVDDASPATEKFYPYNVAAPHLEALSICNAKVSAPSTPPPSTPPSTPPPSPPPPTCTDGVCSTSLHGLPVLMPSLVRSQQVVLRSETGGQANPLQLGLLNASLGTVGGACEYDGQSPSWWDSYSQYQPAYQVQTKAGIWVDAPSPDGVHTRSCFPHPSSPFRDNCASPDPYSKSNPQVCCTGGSEAYNIVGWTYSGRWIAPWSSGGTVKLGGWGNSGCGMPIVPLSNSRSSIINAIKDLDVPLERSSALPDLGYSGTLINEGLVWAWRTISPNWLGLWKQSNGTKIEATLPKAYDDPGAAKAVVIMTDGVNFLPDRDARTAYGSTVSMFAQKSVLEDSTTTSTIFPPVTENRVQRSSGTYQWLDVDSSAYGVLRGLYAKSGNQGAPDKQVSACNLRAAASSNSWGEDALHSDSLGCRPFACMIRDSGGNCLTSGLNIWSPKLADTLVGPYYDELLSRLVTTCTNMRAHGVRVFFILFAVNDNPQKASTTKALTDCIDTSGKVYNAADAAELKSAFADILAQVRRLSLTH